MGPNEFLDLSLAEQNTLIAQHLMEWDGDARGVPRYASSTVWLWEMWEYIDRIPHSHTVNIVSDLSGEKRVILFHAGHMTWRSPWVGFDDLPKMMGLAGLIACGFVQIGLEDAVL